MLGPSLVLGRFLVVGIPDRLQVGDGFLNASCSYRTLRLQERKLRSLSRGATYLYDALGRITSTTYGSTAITPTVVYCYDRKPYQGGACGSVDGSITYGHGKLVSVGTVVSESRNTQFDALGRVTRSEQRTAGLTTKAFQYGHNPGGLRTSVVYPAGRVVSYAATGANRVTQVSGVLSGVPRTYATGITYAPQGAEAGMTQGGLTRSWKHNAWLATTEEWVQRAAVTLLKTTTVY